MPKTKRDFLKRSIGHAYVAIERAQGHLADVWSQFRGTHPEMADGLDAMLHVLEGVQSAIDAFCESAWGGAPSDYETWRNVVRRKDPLDNED